MMKPRISLFAEHEREGRRMKLDDPLIELAKHVDFDALGASVDAATQRPSRAKGGRPPYPTLLMIKGTSNNLHFGEISAIKINGLRQKSC